MNQSMKYFVHIGLIGGFSAAALAGCTVTHKIEPSAEPIRIDLNVKIDQEVRVRLDREVEDLIADNPDLF
jgi:hypothetical protein